MFLYYYLCFGIILYSLCFSIGGGGQNKCFVGSRRDTHVPERMCTATTSSDRGVVLGINPGTYENDLKQYLSINSCMSG